MRFIQPKALATLCIVAIVAVSGQYIALASETNYYEGWTGTEDEMECLSQSCNNSDGCSWITDQRNTWYPQVQCAESSGEPAEGCTQTMRKCRKQEIFLEDCEGTPHTVNIYWKGACAGGA